MAVFSKFSPNFVSGDHFESSHWSRNHTLKEAHVLKDTVEIEKKKKKLGVFYYWQIFAVYKQTVLNVRLVYRCTLGKSESVFISQ
jgi:hypothetical protein